jgi:hypothetical protein
VLCTFAVQHQSAGEFPKSRKLQNPHLKRRRCGISECERPPSDVHTRIYCRVLWCGRLSCVNRVEASSSVTGWRKLFRGGALFVLHQFIATVGIDILAGSLTAYVFDVLYLFGKPVPSRTMYWILTGTPYYPVQISLGLILGWLIGRRARQRVMLWVWVLPFAYLTYAVIAIPTLVPNWIPPAYQAGVGESRFKHYFGWGCGGQHPCFDQNAITVLFYIAAAYSIGALLAAKFPRRYHPASRRRDSWAFLTAGFVFLLIGVLELVRVLQQGWRPIYLTIILMPAAIGTFLILYAVLLREQHVSEDSTIEPRVR